VAAGGSVEMPARPSAKPACMSQALHQMATTPSALHWPASAIAASHHSSLLAPQRRTRSPAAALRGRWGGRSGARALAHARDTARRMSARAIIIRLGTDDICDLPPMPVAAAYAHAHAHTAPPQTSAPIARFCLLACCRTLSSRSAAVTFLLSDTFGARQGAKSASPG